MSEQFFILAVILAFGSWSIAIIEMISIHSFSGFFFEIGIPVYRTSIDFGKSGSFNRPYTVIKKFEGKFKFTNENKIYFLSQIFWFKFFRTSTPFPFKASGIIKSNGKIDIVARIPLGTTMFLLFWVIGWTAGTIGMSIQSGNYGALAFGLIGWGFAALIILISYPIEKKRMDLMVGELKEIITAYKKT